MRQGCFYERVHRSPHSGGNRVSARDDFGKEGMGCRAVAGCCCALQAIGERFRLALHQIEDAEPGASVGRDIDNADLLAGMGSPSRASLADLLCKRLFPGGQEPRAKLRHRPGSRLSGQLGPCHCRW